jgi:hypothetical protein
MNKYIKMPKLPLFCWDEYNKVSGFDNTKQIWDTLKISHEGNDATMITKNGTGGRRAREIHDDKGRRANTDLQQAKDPCQQNPKQRKYKMGGS